jgi:hypothetical protein
MKKILILLSLLLTVSTFGQDTVVLAPPKIAEATPTPAPTSVVRGRVFYAETSRPVRRASIMLVSQGGPGEAGGLTDNEGNFEIRNVKAGIYYPMVNAPGVVSPLAFLDFSKVASGGSEKDAMGDAFKDFQKIVVNGVNDVDIQIAARRGGAISGRVMYDDGDAAIGVKVEILRKVDDKFVGVIPSFSSIIGMFAGGGSGSFQSDDRGVFRFSGLPPGEYIVKATENVNHSTGEQRPSAVFESMILGGSGSFLTVYSPDVFEPGAAQIFNVEYGQEMTEVNITIPGRYLYKLGGRVISQKDKTPVRAEITLQRVEDEKTFSLFNEIGKRAQGVKTDAEGAWLFKELPKGKYKVMISPAPARDEYRDDSDDPDAPVTPVKAKTPEPPRFAKKIQEVTIEDKDLNDLTFELGYGAVISGTVTVENLANEMPNSVTIRAENENAELSSNGNMWNYREPPEKATTPKFKREFKIESVSAGKTKFSVIVSDDYFVKSMTAGSVDLLAADYEIKEGERLENVKIVLGKGLGTVKGVVTNDDKEPVSGAQILFLPTDVKRRSATFKGSAYTDETGGYEARLTPGEYALIFVTAADLLKKGEAWDKWVEEQLKSAPTVKIESGKTETLNLKRVK